MAHPDDDARRRLINNAVGPYYGQRQVVTPVGRTRSLIYRRPEAACVLLQTVAVLLNVGDGVRLGLCFQGWMDWASMGGSFFGKVGSGVMRGMRMDEGLGGVVVL